ncbi:3-deoxy-D-manno-octulosonic acid transferase [Marinoscillum sp.]|uniref:3-deoxy-D-manno-octulosonic acid transferase n=1 Tax=Marinoscillum sp. TaxID=2024838 RepID=UPI003BAAA901
MKPSASQQAAFLLINWVHCRMVLLYRLSLWIYGLIIRTLAGSVQKARDFVNGRKGIFEQVAVQLEGSEKDIVWVHAASVGEYEQGKPIIEALKRELPHLSILLTFFSPSGYNSYKQSAHVDYVFYLPMDSPSNAKRFLELVNPKIALFIKYEFWYFYMLELARRDIPLLLVSSVFRPNQMFFQRFGTFYLRALQSTSHFLVQDDDSKTLLQSYGIAQVTVSGDTRIDQMLQVREEAWPSEVLASFTKDHLVIVCGSLWPSDWDLIREVISKMPEVRIIIAPHEISEDELQSYEAAGAQRITKFQENDSYQILLVDYIGDLKRMYRYGHFAYVGGAFRGAVHNVIEPAVYGLPIVIGEHANNDKFVEVRELKYLGGIKEAADSQQLFSIFESLVYDQELRKSMSEVCQEYVQQHAGATDKVMKKIKELL